MRNSKEMLDFDREHIWHPYTSMLDPLQVYPVSGASGTRINLADGRSLIDGMASWWCMIHGYNNPVLNQALQEQSREMSHVMFGGLTHEPAVDLARILVDLTPQGLNRVFLADSGSVSVEVALKMALQYWQGKGTGRRNKFVALKKGYHGDTFGAMSVCDPVTGMHAAFNGFLAENYFVEEPQCAFADPCMEKDSAELENILKRFGDSIAAVILEPIVQGAGGMRFYSPQYLARVRQLCFEYNVLLIADEIATGFGRSGRFFACEHAGISPDIMCLGKALTGGYMTLAAALCTDDVAETISGGGPGVFMHGPTFMGNPLACKVAAVSIDLLLRSSWAGKVASIERIMNEKLAACSGLSGVKDVRVLGAIGVVEMEKEVDVPRAQEIFVQRGVWIRPFKNLIYIMPPYIIAPDDLEILCTAIYDAARELG